LHLFIFYFVVLTNLLSIAALYSALFVLRKRIRLRKLRNDDNLVEIDVVKRVQRINASFILPKSLRLEDGRSETQVVDRNLRMYITETLAITDEKLINHVIAVKFLRS
jgi:hypothetical protein